MTFNSLVFATFLPVTFILHWWLGRENVRRQNMILLAASYVFYGTWSFKFLLLLMATTSLDYWAGLRIAESERPDRRRFWFWLSVSANIISLGFFKYYNFFITEFAQGILGHEVGTNWTLKIILPIGISFYTFHGLSYIIDLYKGRIRAERSLVNYALFVSFFPLLVAGPLERATHLLPQLVKPRRFNREAAVDGMRQILWGLLKKIVIADNCGEFVNSIFKHSSNYSASAHVVGAFFFAFQLYGDFSGYSDIAIGVARLFNVDLLRNFAFPFFSRNMVEFWRRWHISLYSWFRDYIYIPMGGSRVVLWKRIRNTFIVFAISGFWHGAHWTYVLNGLLNGIYLLPVILSKKRRIYEGTVAEGKRLPSLHELYCMVFTFTFTALSLVLFRSESFPKAILYFREIFSRSLWSVPRFPNMDLMWLTFVLIVLFVIVEWQGRVDQYAIQKVGFHWKRPWRWGFYYLLILCIFTFAGSNQQFIYFQF